MTRLVKLEGGPLDGQTVPMVGTHLEQSAIYPPKRMPGNEDAMIFDQYGFVRWVDPDLNPTITHHRYEYTKTSSRGGWIAEYVGEFPLNQQDRQQTAEDETIPLTPNERQGNGR